MRCEKAGGSPEEVAGTRGSPGFMAVDETSLYWCTGPGGAVMRVEKTGGTPARLAMGGFAGGLAVFQDRVLWVDEGRKLMEVSQQGGTSRVIETFNSPVMSLKADSSGIYVALRGLLDYGEDSTIIRIPLTGGAAILVAEQTWATDIALGEHFIYWLRAITEGGYLIRRAKQGGEPEILATDLARPYRMVVAGGQVFWTEDDRRSVRKLNVPLSAESIKLQ